jgi:hypothetical protein
MSELSPLFKEIREQREIRIECWQRLLLKHRRRLEGRNAMREVEWIHVARDRHHRQVCVEIGKQLSASHVVVLVCTQQLKYRVRHFLFFLLLFT